MSSLSPFEMAQNTGNQISRGFRANKDKNAIDEILGSASESGDPKDLDAAMAQILSRVSKEKQPIALKILESKRNSMLQDKRAKADQSFGFSEEFSSASPDVRKAAIDARKTTNGKPAISLTESLNQVEKRYQNKTKALRLPFEKSDSFGNIFLDFDENEENRGRVLSSLKKELDVYTQQVANEYRKSGVPVPQDVLDDIAASVQIDVGGEKVGLDVAMQLDDFAKKFPPAKHKGRTATDPESGRKIVSDGVKWTFVEETQEGR